MIEKFCGNAQKLGMGLNIRLMTVTPDVAAQWLTKVHPRNRNRTPSRVSQYGTDMINETFGLSDQCVSFDTDGMLINGANRCAAAVNSGASFLSLVLYGLPRKSFKHLDGGKKRNTDENAKIAGIDIPKGAGSTVRRVIMGYATWAGRAVTDDEVFAFVRSYSESIKFAHTVLPRGRMANAMVRAVVTRAHIAKAPRNRLEEFGRVLMTGFMNPGDEAAIQLRNYIMEGERSATKTRVNMYGMAQTALVYFLAHDPKRRVVVGKNEQFPLPEEIADNAAQT